MCKFIFAQFLIVAIRPSHSLYKVLTLYKVLKKAIARLLIPPPCNSYFSAPYFKHYCSMYDITSEKKSLVLFFDFDIL